MITETLCTEEDDKMSSAAKGLKKMDEILKKAQLGKVTKEAAAKSGSPSTSNSQKVISDLVNNVTSNKTGAPLKTVKEINPTRGNWYDRIFEDNEKKPLLKLPEIKQTSNAPEMKYAPKAEGNDIISRSTTFSEFKTPLDRMKSSVNKDLNYGQKLLIDKKEKLKFADKKITSNDRWGEYVTEPTEAVKKYIAEVGIGKINQLADNIALNNDAYTLARKISLLRSVLKKQKWVSLSNQSRGININENLENSEIELFILEKALNKIGKAEHSDGAESHNALYWGKENENKYKNMYNADLYVDAYEMALNDDYDSLNSKKGTIVADLAMQYKMRIDDDEQEHKYNKLRNKKDFYENSQKPNDNRKFSESLARIDFVNYDNMTWSEKETAFYICNTMGSEELEKYLDFISRRVNARAAEGEKERLEKFAGENPLVSTVGNIALSPVSSIGALKGTLKQNFKNAISGRDDGIDINSLDFTGRRTDDVTTSKITKNMNDFEKALYGVATSYGKIAMASPLGPTAALVFISTDAGTQAVYDATKRGASAEEAFNYGVASGAITYFTGKIGIERLFNMAKMPKNTWGSSILKITQQAGIEGTEEVVEQVLTNIADDVIMGEKSNYSILVKEYISSGYTEEEAKNKAFVETYIYSALEAFGAGALGGVISGSGATIIGGVRGRTKKINNKQPLIDLPTAEDVNTEKTYDLPTAEDVKEYNSSKLDLPTAEDVKNYYKEIDLPTADDISINRKYSIVSFDNNKESGEFIQKIKDGLGKVKTTPIFNIDNMSIMDTGKTSESINNYFNKIGGSAVNPILGEIELTKKGAKSTVFHGIGNDKFIATAAVKDVIEKGDIIDHVENWKDRGYDTYIIAGRGKMNSIDSIVGVVVKAYPGRDLKNKFYLHEVIKIGDDPNILVENPRHHVSDMEVDINQNESTPTKNIPQPNGIVNNTLPFKVVLTPNIPMHLVDSVNAIKKKTGIDVVFGTAYNADGSINTKYRGEIGNNRIVVSENATKASVYRSVILHELTHGIEGTSLYNDIKNYVINKKYGVNQEQLRADISAKIQQYKNNGVDLTQNGLDAEKGAMAEIVAENVEEYIFAEDVKSIVERDYTFGQKIYDLISELIYNFKKKYNLNVDELASAQRKYRLALDEVKRNGVQTVEGKYSIFNSFYSEYDKWVKNGENYNISLTVGRTSDALKLIGIEDKEIKWDSGKIKKIKKEHNLNDKIIKQVPEIIENPVIIMDSLQKQSRLTILGEVYDLNNKPVLAVLELEPTNLKGDIILDEIKIASAYGKDNVQNLINNSNILYVDKNKKRINNWLTHNRLQLPLGQNNYQFSNDIVSQSKTNVNNKYMQNTKNNSAFTEKTEMQLAFERAQAKKQYSFVTEEDTETSENTDVGENYSELYKQLIENYGAIRKGEIPKVDVKVPNKSDKKQYVSKFARTFAESGLIDEQMQGEFERLVVEGKMSHEVLGNKRAERNAARRIEESGFQDAVNEFEILVKEGRINKNDVAMGQMLLNVACQAKDVNMAKKLAVNLSLAATQSGRNVQAFSMLKRMSPDGQLYYLERTVQKINNDLNSKFEGKHTAVEIDADLAKKLLDADTEGKMNDAVHEIEKNIGEQIPSTLKDKWDAWRYLAMLGNARTHVRNVLGNAMFVPIRGLKNIIGTAMEKGISKENRTKAVFKSKESKTFAEQDWEIMMDAVKGNEGKYNTRRGIEDHRTIFKNKFLELARKLNTDILEAEDTFFLKRAYENALAQAMSARGLTADYLNSGTKEANVQLSGIRNYALKEAQKATFRDLNEFSDLVGRMRFKGDGIGSTLGNVAIEGVLPFKKTPANILVRGVEYSPIGLTKGLVNLGRTVRNENITASKAIDEIASGLTGTGVVGLGMLLTSMGILVVQPDEDDEVAGFMRMNGSQNYALNINGHIYTIDWLAPTSLPLFVGAETYNTIKNTDKFTLSAAFDSLTRIADPAFELSCLSGVQDALESVKYSEGNAVGELVIDMMLSYIMQGLPTVGGQFARSIDNTKRNAYYKDKNSNLPYFINSFISQVAAKIPGATYLLPEKIDRWGRVEKYGSLPERVLENFISPGYYSNDKSTETDKRLMDLYRKTGDSSVLPDIASKSFKDDEGIKYLSADEYVEYSKKRGLLSYDYVTEFLNKADVENLEDSTKTDIINDLYGYANALAKSQVSSYAIDGKYEKAQLAEKAGISPVKYFTLSNIGVPGFDEEDIREYEYRIKNGENEETVINDLYQRKVDSMEQNEVYKEYSDKAEGLINEFDYGTELNLNNIYGNYKNENPDATTIAVPKASKKFSYDGNKYDLTPEQYADLQNRYNIAYYEGIKDIVNDDGLSSAEKYEQISTVRKTVQKIVKAQFAKEVLGYSDTKASSKKTVGSTNYYNKVYGTKNTSAGTTNYYKKVYGNGRNSSKGTTNYYKKVYGG